MSYCIVSTGVDELLEKHKAGRLSRKAARDRVKAGLGVLCRMEGMPDTLVFVHDIVEYERMELQDTPGTDWYSIDRRTAEKLSGYAADPHAPTKQSVLEKWLAGYPDEMVYMMFISGTPANDVGDTLFEFMYLEGRDAAGDKEEFRRMLERAKCDIDAVIDKL